jgi:hypothetical protein
MSSTIRSALSPKKNAVMEMGVEGAQKLNHKDFEKMVKYFGSKDFTTEKRLADFHVFYTIQTAASLIPGTSKIAYVDPGVFNVKKAKGEMWLYNFGNDTEKILLAIVQENHWWK